MSLNFSQSVLCVPLALSPPQKRAHSPDSSSRLKDIYDMTFFSSARNYAFASDRSFARRRTYCIGNVQLEIWFFSRRFQYLHRVTTLPPLLKCALRNPGRNPRLDLIENVAATVREREEKIAWLGSTRQITNVRTWLWLIKLPVNGRKYGSLVVCSSFCLFATSGIIYFYRGRLEGKMFITSTKCGLINVCWYFSRSRVILLGALTGARRRRFFSGAEAASINCAGCSGSRDGV